MHEYMYIYRYMRIYTYTYIWIFKATSKIHVLNTCVVYCLSRRLW